MLGTVIFIVIGFALLIKGADWLVDGASSVAKRFHIPEIVIGLTIVSIGTSMPELVVSVTSALNGHSDMAMGNVIGSNVCNLLLILGLSAAIKPIKFQRETRLIEIPLSFAFSVLFMLLCNSYDGISRPEAVVLIGLFALFIIYTILMSVKGEQFDAKDDENKQDKIQNSSEESNKKETIDLKEATGLGEVTENSDSKKVIKEKQSTSILKNILYIIIGVIALKIGGDLTVDNAVVIAKYFNLSEQIISLTILAVGTSLPELVTSVMAAIKGNSDIAIGNIIGSNIFNMLLIIGVASFISPIAYNVTYNIDMIILLIGTLVLALFPAIPPKNKMTRTNGIIYLMMYAGYIAILFNK